MNNIARISPRLDDFVNVELLSKASAEEISSIWEQYHAEKYCISAVIEKSKYLKIRKLWTNYPTFLLPRM